MAFPSVATRATSSQTSSTATSQVVTLPSSIAAGDLIIVAIAGGETGGTYSWPGSWVEIADFEITTGENEGMTIGYLWASGGETSVTVTSTVGQRTTHCSVRITGAQNPTTEAPYLATTSGGGSPECDPPNLAPAPGAKDFLWLAIAGSANGGTFTAAPTNYSNLQTVNSGGTTSSHTSTGMGERQNNATSDNPGAFTHDDASTRDWCSATMAIPPSSGAGALIAAYAKATHAVGPAFGA